MHHGPDFKKVLVLRQLRSGVVRILDVDKPMHAVATGKAELTPLVLDATTVDLLNKEIAVYDIGCFSTKMVPRYGWTLVFEPSDEFRYPDHAQRYLHRAFVAVFGFVQIRVLVSNEDRTDVIEYCVEPHGLIWISYKDGIRCYDPIDAATAYGGGDHATAGS